MSVRSIIACEKDDLEDAGRGKRADRSYDPGFDS